MVDIAATVMDLSGAGVPDIADGSPIPLKDLLPSFAYPYTITAGADKKGRHLLSSGSRRSGGDQGLLYVESGFEGPDLLDSDLDPDSDAGGRRRLSQASTGYNRGMREM